MEENVDYKWLFVVVECPDNCLHCMYDGTTTKCYQEGCMTNFKQDAAGACTAGKNKSSNHG